MRFILLLMTLCYSVLALSQALQIDPPVAERGDAVIYLSDLDRAVMDLPENIRSGYLDDPDRIQNTVSNLLLERQTASQIGKLDPSRQSASDRNSSRNIWEDKQLATEVRDMVLEKIKAETPDFRPLARERYLASPAAYQDKPRWTFRHVLIREGDRSEVEARSLAEQARQAFLDPNVKDDDVVAKYLAEEEGPVSERGFLTDLVPERMVTEFRSVFALTEVGSVSDVVKTRFGFHVVKLLSYTPGTAHSFEDVQAAIVDELMKEHIRKKTAEFDDELRNQPTKADPDLVLSLRTRYRDAGKGIIAPIVPHQGVIDPSMTRAAGEN